MMVDSFDRTQYHEATAEIIKRTIYENPYILFKPYPRQLWPIFEVTKPLQHDEANKALIGAGGYGGKTYLGSMLAAQYLEFPKYSCLVTRLNYAELTGEDSIWENLNDWICDENRLGEKACKSNESKLRITAPSGAKIWFKAFDHVKKKGKVKSESYDRIINDEASELDPKILTFIYRSLRSDKTSHIPLSMINLSNPGGPSTDYLCETFVDGTDPYYPLDWRHNPFINKKIYSKTLDNLDFIDQKYQKDGDWHYKPAKGELFPEKLLNDCIIPESKLENISFVRNLRGLDIAITKKGDYTAFVKWQRDSRGHNYITDLVHVRTEFPEETFIDVIEKDNPEWEEGIFETEYYPEKGVAESGVLAKRYLKQILRDYLDKGLVLKFIKPMTNKFTRARPMARAFKNNEVSIVEGKWNKALIDEFKDFGPDDKEYDHDDIIDAGSVGFNKLVKKLPSFKVF